jgi:hypothetical protein
MREKYPLFLILVWLRSVALASNLANISLGNGAVFPVARDHTTRKEGLGWFST